MDKTPVALQLVDEGTHYFLSFPRRFGKSLFVDTLKELFEGSRELFEGLEAYEDWDWSVRCPVVRLEFGAGNFKEPGYLHTNLAARLGVIERATGVEPLHDTGPERLDHLLRTLHDRTGQRVAVLVDEYDKPILDLHSRRRTLRRPIAITCTACTRCSRIATLTFASASSPG